MMLLQQLISPRYQFELCTKSGCFPTHIPTARRWVTESPPPPKHLDAFLKTVPYLKPDPRVFALHEMLNKEGRANERAMMKLATPSRALRDAARQIDDILERQRRRQAEHR